MQSPGPSWTPRAGAPSIAARSRRRQRRLVAMSLPMQRLQVADRVLGRLAAVALQPLRALRRREVGPARRVLAIKFWGLGSLQLLTPAVASLRHKHPDAELTLLTLEGNRSFAEGLGVFDEVRTIDLDVDGWVPLAGRILGALRAVRAGGFDAVYDFEFFTRFSAVVSLWSGAPRSHGFTAPGVSRGGSHTDLVRFERGWHVARNFRALADGEDGFDLEPRDFDPFQVTLAHRLEVATVLIENGLCGEGPLIVLNVNAGELSLERRWPADRFAELARRLVIEDGARVVLVGSTEEREHVRHVRALIGDLPPERCANLSGQLSFGGLVALLREAEVFVTNDSGPMHVAAAQGVPTLGLFGPETPLLYRPIGRRARFLYVPTPCSPCINVHENKLAVCFRGRSECMTNLPVGYVLAATRDEIGRQRELAPAQEIARRR